MGLRANGYVDEVVGVVLDAPLDEVLEHLLDLFELELACSKEPQQVPIVVALVVRDFSLFYPGLELGEQLGLLFGHVFEVSRG